MPYFILKSDVEEPSATAFSARSHQSLHRVRAGFLASGSFYLPRLPIPVSDSGFCRGVRQRLQRRDRNGIAPFSLLSSVERPPDCNRGKSMNPCQLSLSRHGRHGNVFHPYGIKPWELCSRLVDYTAGLFSQVVALQFVKQNPRSSLRWNFLRIEGATTFPGMTHGRPAHVTFAVCGHHRQVSTHGYLSDMVARMHRWAASGWQSNSN
jgi:hypothetical protein